eukprot:TRINITY_DN5265_c0_g1_i1.p1 TRINITY_DN5265_c0_g1~~TRINITY_DN5265_c0_g1_i1.p1  ORF type:complete len:369 (-),score=67.64 TRINITY_DN5265_c0_g1_i1:85-1128(-)
MEKMEKMDVESSPSPSASSNKKDNTNLPWVEKYRPTKLADLISHTEIIDTIVRLIEENQFPHLLFYGPPGTGKTSTILACAHKLFGPSFSSMTLELNASDDRGIDVVREQIKDFASTQKIFAKGFKLIILDEADAMTGAAQAALRRVIEKYSKNTRFCLICNHVSKITPAIQSRCTRFRFSPLKDEHMITRIAQIAKLEKVTLDDSAMKSIIKLSTGDMRKALNILQSCSMSGQEITSEMIYTSTGNPSPADIATTLDYLLNSSFDSAFQNIQKLKSGKGLALVDMVREIHLALLKMDISDSHKTFLIKKLADGEYRLASGTSEKLQLGGLVGVFQIARDRIASQAE